MDWYFWLMLIGVIEMTVTTYYISKIGKKLLEKKE